MAHVTIAGVPLVDERMIAHVEVHGEPPRDAHNVTHVQVRDGPAVHDVEKVTVLEVRAAPPPVVEADTRRDRLTTVTKWLTKTEKLGEPVYSLDDGASLRQGVVRLQSQLTLVDEHLANVNDIDDKPLVTKLWAKDDVKTRKKAVERLNALKKETLAYSVALADVESQNTALHALELDDVDEWERELRTRLDMLDMQGVQDDLPVVHRVLLQVREFYSHCFSFPTFCFLFGFVCSKDVHDYSK